MNIIEYNEQFSEDVKDLFVELKVYLSSLDVNGIITLKDNYREGYFAYVLEEVEKHPVGFLLQRILGELSVLSYVKFFKAVANKTLQVSAQR